MAKTTKQKSDRYQTAVPTQKQMLRILLNLEVVAVSATAAGQACYLVVPAETETQFRNGLKKLGYSL
jgi:hypothetical protein